MNINSKENLNSAADSEAEETAATGGELPENDSSLDALVSEEQTYVRERLRREMGREPTDEEADKWLSEQTEGY